MSEVVIHAEGTLRFVQASGTGNTWATASAPVSGTLGFIKALSYTSAQTIVTVTERGIPSHHKITERAPIDVTFQFLITGRHFSALSGSGATVPMFHIEARYSAAHIGNGTTGHYLHLFGVAMESIAFAEAPEGSTIDIKGKALGMGQWTGSGYLS